MNNEHLLEKPEEMERRPKPQGLRVGTLDWLTLAQLLLLFVMSVFMIYNVQFSATAIAPFQLRYGSSLSMQTWLLIIAAEFSTLFGNLVGRLSSVLASQYLTKRLESGLSLSTLLNSLDSAPLLSAQVRGIRLLLLQRILLLAMGTGIAMGDKFSFTSIPIDNVELFGLNTNAVVITSPGDIATQTNIPLATNFLDIVGFGDLTSIRYQNRSFIVGPAVNVSVPDSLIQGTVLACDTQSYYQYNLSSTHPLSADQLNGDAYSLSFLNGMVMDFGVTTNGTLVIGFPASNSQSTNSTSLANPDYYIVSSEACEGYASWYKNNTTSGVLIAATEYILLQPQSFGCIQMQFNLTSWLSNRMLNVTLAFMEQAGFADNNGGLQGVIDPATTDSEYLILQVLASTTADNLSPFPDQPTISGPVSPVHPSCLTIMPATCTNNSECARSAVLGTGLFAGTGITMAGVAFQVFAASVTLITTIYIICSRPPLITTWPAQWLVMLTDFNNRDLIQKTVEGTSIGQNAARGDTEVFLSSTLERPYPRLELSESKGTGINRKVKHL